MSKTRKDREGNIRLRADGRWEVRVTIGIDYATGEERRISRYAKTQEEAIKLLHELSFIRDHTPNNFQSVTVSEWLPFCLETYMRPTLKQSTYLSYESYIRVHLNPALGNIQLKELTPRILQQYYNYKAETEKLSPKTIVGHFVGPPFMAEHCVSKRIGRHDAACQGCPRYVSRSPGLLRRGRRAQCVLFRSAVLPALLI